MASTTAILAPCKPGVIRFETNIQAIKKELVKSTFPHPCTEFKVLKATWRDPDCTSGAKVYEAVHQVPPSRRVEFLIAGPGNASVRQSHNSTRDMSPIQHRMLLNSGDRPLWKYSSELELLKAIRAVTIAHRSLWNHRILHRNIHVRNIRLPKVTDAAPNSKKANPEGILTDYDFTHVPSVTRQLESVQLARKASLNAEKTPTGVHFMAEELLESILGNSQVQHTPEHDVESIIIVLVYAILKKLMSSAGDSDRKAMKPLFWSASSQSAFAHNSIMDIVMARLAVFKWISGPFAQSLSIPLRSLIVHFARSVDQQRTARAIAQIGSNYPSAYQDSPNILLNHAFLLKALNIAIIDLL